MPYDIQALEPTVFTDLTDYIDFCGREYFSFCKDLSVLEVGPYDGHHTKSIIAQSPKSTDVVEGNRLHYGNLKEIPGISQIYVDDVMLFLQNKRPYDVVVCLGVLYHLHSPLHLLELIVNNCSPKYVILDCVMAPQELQF
jgi:phospholipid N-methyltransferase